MILKNEIQGNKVQETAALVQSLQVNWFDYVQRVMGNVMGNDVSGLQLQLLFSKVTYGFVLDLFCFLYFFVIVFLEQIPWLVLFCKATA